MSDLSLFRPLIKPEPRKDRPMDKKLARSTLAQNALPFSVFIQCRTCGSENCFADIPARRNDLAMFRGLENPVTCKGCHADMDTMLAFCGERVGIDIERRPDPDH